MKIKDNMANIVSIARIFIAFAAVWLMTLNDWKYFEIAFVLTIIAFAMDGLDGYIARKFNQSSAWGSVLDIMGDRIVEMTYWIAFACLGLIPMLYPIICVTRAFVTDSIRSVALSKGMTAFGEKTMQSSTIGKFICASRFMRISYAVAKVVAFVLLIVVAGIESLKEPLMHFTSDFLTGLGVTAQILAFVAVFFCVIRGLPVVLESGKLFNNETKQD